MLYLLPIETGEGARAEHVPVAELTAIGFERALLAADTAERERELSKAFARDPAVAAWATEVAQRHDRCAECNDAAITWLAGCLETTLAAALACKEEQTGRGAIRPAEIDFRLPALARLLAGHTQRLAEFRSRLEREKFEALKELAYGASHEINNPLANIAARAQTLLEEEADPERRRKLAAIHRQAMRAHEMIADLMLFARPPRLTLATCDVRPIVRQVVEELRERANEQGTQICCDHSDRPLESNVDATQLAVALHAVVINALEAVGDGGHVQVDSQAITLAGESEVEISVRDDGPGISEDVRQHMFDPFFSGREAGRGLGFGLSKCWRIVTDHGGQVVVHRPANGGAQIAIRLPLQALATDKL
jgi:signal transduction histidine kinase